jgi:hypothetical protein
VFKCTFTLEKIMKLICIKWGYENHYIPISKKLYILLEPISLFFYHILETRIHTQKLTSKVSCIF